MPATGCPYKYPLGAYLCRLLDARVHIHPLRARPLSTPSIRPLLREQQLADAYIPPIPAGQPAAGRPARDRGSINQVLQGRLREGRVPLRTRRGRRRVAQVVDERLPVVRRSRAVAAGRVVRLARADGDVVLRCGRGCRRARARGFEYRRWRRRRRRWYRSWRRRQGGRVFGQSVHVNGVGA